MASLGSEVCRASGRQGRVVDRGRRVMMSCTHRAAEVNDKIGSWNVLLSQVNGIVYACRAVRQAP